MNVRKTRKDVEWEAILEKLMDTGLELTERYKEDYLEAMKGKCLDAFKLNKSGNIEELKHTLYDISSWFYPFGSRMKEYNRYAAKNGLKQISFVWHEMPGSHNYNSYLRYLDKELAKLYYLKMVEVVLDYANHEAMKIPEFIYELYKGKNGFYVSKLKWIETIGISDETELALPGYYSINLKYCLDKEQIRELFYKTLKQNQEQAYQKFLKKEYPIYEYVMKNLYREEL